MLHTERESARWQERERERERDRDRETEQERQRQTETELSLMQGSKSVTFISVAHRNRTFQSGLR